MSDYDDLAAAMRERRAALGLDDPTGNPDADPADPADVTDQTDPTLDDGDQSDAHPDDGAARWDADGLGAGDGAEPHAANRDDADDDAPPAAAAGDAPPEPASDAAPAAPAAPVESEYVDIGGRLFHRDQLPDVARLLSWAEDQIMQAPVAGTPTAASAPPASGTPAAPDPAPAFDPEQFVDADLARAVDARFKEVLDPIQSRMDQLIAFQEAEQARMFAAQQAELDAANVAAREAIAERFNLDAESLDRLERLTAQDPVAVQIALAEHPNDPTAGFTAALETRFWATPEYRERIVQSATQTAAEAAADAERERIVAAQRDAKKDRASAFSGGSGAVSRATPPPATKQGRRAGMADAIAAALSDN